MAIDRGEYVDQSQSFNAWFVPNVTYQQITSFHFYGWENGMKTGMYYLPPGGGSCQPDQLRPR